MRFVAEAGAHATGTRAHSQFEAPKKRGADRRVAKPPAGAKRLPILRDNQGNWLYDAKSQTTTQKVKVNAEMKRMKAKWKKLHG